MVKGPSVAEREYLEKVESALSDGVKRLEEAIRILSQQSVQLDSLSNLLLKSRVDVEYAGAVVATLHEFESWDALPRHRAKASDKEHAVARLSEAVEAIGSLGRPLPHDDAMILSALMRALSCLDAAIQWCERGIRHRRLGRRGSTKQ